MAFYQLTVQGVASNQQVNNVFHYVTTSLLASNQEAFDLNTEFSTEVLPFITAVLHLSYQAQTIYTIAPQAPDVFAALPFSPNTQVGVRTGEALPLFASWGFEVLRQRRDIRNGYKRFGPIAEIDQTGGNPTTNALNGLNNLKTAMNTALDLNFSGNTSTATMVVVKRVRYNPDPLRPDRWAYRIPGPGDPLVYYEATDWVFERITTQNTRKIGRGS